MNRTTYVKMLFCTLLVLASCAACMAQVYVPQPFTADMSITSHNGEKIPGKLYFSPPSVRMDMSTKGHNISSITDGATQTNYVVMHDQHMYMVMHNNQPNPMMGQMPKVDSHYDPANPCGQSTNCKKLGTETVNGRVCDKWQATSNTGTSTFWVDQKLHFPIKVQNADGSAMEYSNIVEGKPDASLFQPPAGYRKMDMSGMMGGGRPPQ